MTLYWGFDLEAVAARCLYLDRITETDTVFEIVQRIEAFREQQTLPARVAIPV